MENSLFRRNVYIFICAAEEGSFSAAGRKLRMTQAAVSQQIDKLEDSLQFKLFDRSGYRPVLTDAGSYFYKKCARLDRLYCQIERSAKNRAESAGQSLRIGITGPFEEKHLPDIITAYHRLFPQIKVDIKIYTFIAGITELEKNNLDIAFGITNDFKDKKNLQIFPLWKHNICVVCSAHHPFAQKTAITGKELTGQPIISFSTREGTGFYSDFLKSFGLDGVRPVIVRETENLDELILAVKLNQGIALLARAVIPEDPELCAVPVVRSHHHAEFCVGIGKNNPKKYLMPFINLVQQYFSALKA
jgi:DNA-binding transcriptional LysR family regulator